MNKLFNKIATITLGLAMAIGVGVAAGGKDSGVTSARAAYSSGTFAKYSGTLTEGYYVFTYGIYTLHNTIASNRFTNGAEITSGVATLSNPSTADVWYVAPSATSGYWTLYNEAVSKYAGTTSTNNRGSLNSTEASDYFRWSCSSNAQSTTYDFVNKGNPRYLRQNGTNGWAAYASTTGGALTLYKLVTLSSIAVSGQKTSYVVGESFVKPTVTATYSNGSTSDVSNKATFSGFDSSSAVASQTITASYTEGGTTKTTTYNISITSSVAVTGVELNKNSTSLQTGSTETLIATVSPSDASNKNVTWSTGNASVATVSDGVVTAVGVGTTSITATTVDGGFSDSCTVTVTKGMKKETYYKLTPKNGTNNSYSGNCDIDVTYQTKTITWNLTGNSQIDPWRLGGKNLSNTSRALYSKTAMGSAISNIVVTFGTINITVNSSTLIVSTNSDFSNPVETKTFTAVASETVTITPTSGSWPINSYYKFVFSVTETEGSNKYLSFASADFNSIRKVNATIGGDSSVNSGTQWSSTGVNDEDSDPVTGVTYSFTATENVQITSSDTSAGTFTATCATPNGTVTVSADAGSVYSISNKIVTINPTLPFITLNKSETSGYTGQNETISFTFGNFSSGSPIVSSNDTSKVTVGTPSISGNSGTVQINFVGGGSTTVSFNYGETELASLSVSVTPSTVSITGLPSTESVYTTKTIDLGDTITVTATGSCSTDVTWSSANSGIASVDPDTGVVTGVAEGTVNITVTSDDYPSATMTCAVTVTELPLVYEINFGSIKNTNPTEIKTDENFKDTWDNDIDDITVGDISKIYGVTSSQLKGGSGSATASISFTIPSTSYITSVVIVVETAGGTSMNVVSGAAGAQTENQTIATGTLTFDDYLASEKSNYVLITSTATGAFYLSSITIHYANFEPELTASPSSFDVAVNGTQNVTLTPSYFTPTDYSAVVKSGSSLTASAVSFSGNVATVTAGASTGLTVFTITGSGGGKNASVDISVNVTLVRNLTNLTITTASDKTTFKVGETFDVGSLVITATFDADPTTVVYSKANGNLGVLTATPAIGYEFQESDIGNSKTATFALEVGTGNLSVTYSYNVIDKTYAAKITSVQDLWDGQQIYFGDQEGTRVNIAHAGGNQLGSQIAVVHETKGLSIDELAHDGAYTVHREKIDSVIYYSFVKDGYYLEASNASNNYLTRTDTLSDNCRYTISITNTGVVTMTNKGNSGRPTFRWNSGSNWFTQYQSSSELPKAVIYAITSYSEQAVADAFAERYLHMDEEVEGQCNTYYPILKPVWAAMGDLEKVALSGAPYERLQAWAAAHGEHLNSNMDLVANTRINLIAKAIENSGVAIIVIILSVTSVAAIGGYFFLRKKKEQ